MFSNCKNVSERPSKMDPVCCLTHKWYHHSFIRIKLHRHHTLFLWFFCYCSIPFIDKLTLITTMKKHMYCASSTSLCSWPDVEQKFHVFPIEFDIFTFFNFILMTIISLYIYKMNLCLKEYLIEYRFVMVSYIRCLDA